jgi:hypothetical protein
LRPLCNIIAGVRGEMIEEEERGKDIFWLLLVNGSTVIKIVG